MMRCVVIVDGVGRVVIVAIVPMVASVAILFMRGTP